MSALQHAARSARTSKWEGCRIVQVCFLLLHSRTLLLYNPALWGGERMVDFDFYWNERHATKADDEASWEHHTITTFTPAR